MNNRKMKCLITFKAFLTIYSALAFQRDTIRGYEPNLSDYMKKKLKDVESTIRYVEENFVGMWGDEGESEDE